MTEAKGHQRVAPLWSRISSAKPPNSPRLHRTRAGGGSFSSGDIVKGPFIDDEIVAMIRDGDVTAEKPPSEWENGPGSKPLK